MMLITKKNRISLTGLLILGASLVTQVVMGLSVNNSNIVSAQATQNVPMSSLNMPSLQTKGIVDARNDFGSNASVSSAGLTSTQKGQIVVLENGKTVSGGSFTSSPANVKAALYKIYSDARSATSAIDFTLYFGANVQVPGSAEGNDFTGTASATNITFAALGTQSNVKSLTMVSSQTDPLNTPATDARTVTFTNTLYLGVPTRFRNINWGNGVNPETGAAPAGQFNLFAQGQPIWMDNGAVEVAGGNNTYQIMGGYQGSVASNASTNVYIGSTTNDANVNTLIMGGSESGSIGDTHVTVNAPNSTGKISYLEGGSLGISSPATVNGSTNLHLINYGGAVDSVLGAGGSAGTVNVSGDVNTLLSSSSNTKYTTIFGGANHTANITGSTYTTLTGSGSWTSNNGNFIGGSRYGNANNIYNKVDTSAFTSGSANFTGAQGINLTTQTYLVSGVVSGNIVNDIKAGSANAGSFNAVYGGMGWSNTSGVNGSAIDSIFASTGNLIASQDQANQYAAKGMNDQGIASASQGQLAVLGNISTIERSGVVSMPGTGVITSDTVGAGLSGYVKGDTTVQVGDGSGTPVTAGNVYGGGGQDTQINQDYFWHTGKSAVIVNNGTTVDNVFGGNLSGFQQGDSAVYMNGGTANYVYGGGNHDVVHDGNNEVTMNGGTIAKQLVAAGKTTKASIDGDAQVLMLGGNLVGSVYGFKGGDDNWFKGSTTVDISGGKVTGGSNVEIIGGAGGGHINGDTTLNLAFNNTMDPLAAGTTIAGNGSKNNTTSAGMGSNQAGTISVNVSDTSNVDHINGNDLNGDIASSGTSSRGNINVNVNATNNTVGNITPATESLLKSQAIQTSTAIDIANAKSVNTINAAGSNDDISNAVNVGSNHLKIDFGDNAVTQVGSIKNFTDLTVGTKANLTITNKLVNGNGATAANHGSQYNKLGNLSLGSDSTLQLANTSTIASVAQLALQGGNVTLMMPYMQTEGMFNLSDIQFNNNAVLDWQGTTDIPHPAENTYVGQKFGKALGYPILTFTGDLAASGMAKLNQNNVVAADAKTQVAYNTDHGSNVDNSKGQAIAYISEGNLSITTPTKIDFGKQSILGRPLVAYPTYDQPVTVSDTRTKATEGSWTLKVATLNPMVSGSNSLADYLKYRDGSQTYAVSSAAVLVHEEDSGQNGQFELSKNWDSTNKQGLYLDIPVSKQIAGNYDTNNALVWTLGSTPSSTVVN